ncbi:MAG TPA: hypothetical protein VIK79_14570 [Xanthobacteraceae bacterium]
MGKPTLLAQLEQAGVQLNALGRELFADPRFITRGMSEFLCEAHKDLSTAAGSLATNARRGGQVGVDLTRPPW